MKSISGEWRSLEGDFDFPLGRSLVFFERS